MTTRGDASITSSTFPRRVSGKRGRHRAIRGWRAITAWLSLSLALAVLGPVVASAQAVGAAVDSTAIDGYVASKKRAPRIPGVALAIAKDDQIVYLKGYGQANPAVLAMASNQPLPDQGPGLGLLTLVLDLVLLALTVALIVALARLPGRYRSLAARGIDGWPDLLRRTGVIAALHLVWPAAVLYLTVAVPLWHVDVGMGQPDLATWLEVVGLVVALKGVLELVLTWRVFRRTGRRPRQQAVWKWSQREETAA